MMLAFDTIHPSFDGALTVDFVNLIPSGATLSSGTVTCAIHPGSEVADASASTRVYGDATVTATTKLKRNFKTGVDGARYVLTFTPTFSDTSIDPIEVVLEVSKIAA